MNDVDLSRRMLLGSAAAIGAGAWVTGSWLPRASASPAGARWTGSRSANGWPVLKAAPPSPVEGSRLSVNIAGGAVATVLLHCVRRFYYEVDDTILADEVVGHRTNRSIDVAYESNYLSATAVAIRPGWYPVGASEGFFDQQLVIVRDILADLEGVVRWGGDEVVPKESHFEIAVPPGDRALERTAARLRGWRHHAGRGAGGQVDPFSAERRKKAEKLRAVQRR